MMDKHSLDEVHFFKMREIILPFVITTARHLDRGLINGRIIFGATLVAFYARRASSFLRMTYFGDGWMTILQKNIRIITFLGTFFSDTFLLDVSFGYFLLENNSLLLKLFEVSLLHHPNNFRKIAYLREIFDKRECAR